MVTLRNIITGASNLKRIELLRYNKIAGAKYSQVGMEYRPSFDTEALPQCHADILKDAGIDVMVL
jgi:pyruvate formate lyase activating enzyme